MNPRIIITEKINFQILDLSFKISFINSSFGKIAQNSQIYTTFTIINTKPLRTKHFSRKPKRVIKNNPKNLSNKKMHEVIAQIETASFFACPPSSSRKCFRKAKKI